MTKSTFSLTHQVTIRQHINCAIALDSTNSTSLILDYEDPVSAGVRYAAVPYASSPTHKDLTEYTAFANLFSQVNEVDCGALTTCEVLPVGCTGTYSGRAAVVANTGALSITQNVDAGYTETLCVKCSNAAGSSVQHDNWKIE